MEKSEIETIYRKYFHDVFLYIRALSENESLVEEITLRGFDFIAHLVPISFAAFSFVNFAVIIFLQIGRAHV